MSVTLDQQDDRTHELEEAIAYRALSPAAVASLVAGGLSISALLAWPLAIVPAVGILLGVVARWKISRHPDELTGSRLATTGIVLSAVFWVAGWSWLTYAYLTEVPEGYQRLSYDVLQPDTSVPGQLYPPIARQLDGKRVFIKGYVYPSKQTSGIRRFLLCRDNGECCFGGQPRLTDMIDVTLKDPLRLEYATRPFAVAGTFRFEPTRTPDGQFAVLYHLEADYLK